MNKRRKLSGIIFLFVLLTLTGCITIPSGTVQTSGYQYRTSDTVLLLKSIAQMDLLAKNEESDAMPASVKSVVLDMQSYLDSNLKIPYKNCFLNNDKQFEIDTTMKSFVKLMIKRESIKGVAIPNALIKLMDENKLNYILSFVTLYGNMTYNGDSYLYSWVYCLVFDKIHKNILYFGEDTDIFKKPWKDKITDSQIQSLIYSFLLNCN